MRVRSVVFMPLLLVVVAGCRNDMYDQPRYEPLEPGSTSSARRRPAS